MFRNEMVAPEGFRPTGRYTVETVDDRGKVKQRGQSNYITPLWENYSKWWPSMMVMHFRFPYNDGASLYTGTQGASVWPSRIRMPHHARPFPWQNVVLTDSDEAEDANTHWLKGNVIAWASFYKTTIPASGKRGLINEAECTISDDGRILKWVWDWTTQQGNGEYQTLGIAAHQANTAIDAIAASTGPHGILGATTTEVAGSDLPQGHGGHVIAGGKWFMQRTVSQSIVTLWQADLPATLATDDYEGDGFIHDATGMTFTQVGGNNPGGMTSGTSGSNHYYAFARGLDYDPAAQMIYVLEKYGATGSGGALRKLNLSGVNQWNADPWGTGGWAGYAPSTNIENSDCVHLGTKVYCVTTDTTGTNNTKVLRFSDAGGAVEASFIMPNDLIIAGGITTDGTDLLIYTSTGLCRITTSGAFVENYGRFGGQFITAATENMTPPWPTHQVGTQTEGSSLAPIPWPAIYDSGNVFVTGLNYAGGDQGSTWQPQLSYTRSGDLMSGFGFCYWNNRLWVKNITPQLSRHMYLGLTGANCMSRTLLDSPVAKTSSQTMKVSYELTLPDIGSFVHDHPVFA